MAWGLTCFYFRCCLLDAKRVAAMFPKAVMLSTLRSLFPEAMAKSDFHDVFPFVFGNDQKKLDWGFYTGMSLVLSN